MKNRKVLIVSFVLVACLTIGIGFAALTGSLRADGIVHINLDDSNLKVQYKKTGESAQFTEAGSDSPAVLTADQYTIEYASEDTVATVTIKSGVLNKIGDKVVIHLPIVNNSTDLDALVKAPTITMQGNATTYLTVNGVAASLRDADATGNVTLKCASNNSGVVGETCLELTIVLNDVPTESNVTCNFSVAINTESATVNADVGNG